jgi:acetyltransferase
MKNGAEVVIRPIRPEDESLMIAFHQTLSEESVYMRYFGALALSQRVAHERLTRICFIDYDREIALVADHTDPATSAHEISAVGRLIKLHSTDAAEFALLVSDRFQHCGLGAELLRRLIAVGREERIGRIVADILPENTGMLHICQQLGFRLKRPIDGPVKAEIEL